MIYFKCDEIYEGKRTEKNSVSAVVRIKSTRLNNYIVHSFHTWFMASFGWYIIWTCVRMWLQIRSLNVSSSLTLFHSILSKKKTLFHVFNEKNKKPLNNIQSNASSIEVLAYFVHSKLERKIEHSMHDSNKFSLPFSSVISFMAFQNKCKKQTSNGSKPNNSKCITVFR